ncbi:MAG: helix-hairpin-helix domain-containing protein [Candidatus Omnitrophica bacterium]|nr:helix-hairpin-helix domain-containing protein [Candidatus Omnitrophota bacterium]
MFSLTQEERKVILFLAVAGLLGLGINFLVKKFAKVESIAYLSQDLGKVNLNSANKATLMGISGIGEKLAQRIIEYREKTGGFSSVQELTSVKGLTAAKLVKIKEYLFVN